MSKQFQGLCIEMYPKFLEKDILKDSKKLASQKAIFQNSAIFKPSSTGNITITFGKYKSCTSCSDSASWSYIGSESNSGSPSMNLGFLDPPFESFQFDKKTYDYKEFKDATRNYCSDQKSDCSANWEPGATCVHETMHALGALHEHQNGLFSQNNTKIKLNKPAILNYYNSIGLGSEGAYTNMLSLYDCEANKANCDYSGTSMDLQSIMLYALPDEFVIGKNPTKPNFKLSKLDKEWLVKKYPMSMTISKMPFLTLKFIDPKDSEPSWKQAWTTKMILEKVAPLVGIKFRFAWADGKSIDFSPVQPVPKQVSITDKKDPELPLPPLPNTPELKIDNVQINTVPDSIPISETKETHIELRNFEPESDKPIIEIETFSNNNNNIIFTVLILILLLISIKFMFHDKLF